MQWAMKSSNTEHSRHKLKALAEGGVKFEGQVPYIEEQMVEEAQVLKSRFKTPPIIVKETRESLTPTPINTDPLLLSPRHFFESPASPTMPFYLSFC